MKKNELNFSLNELNNSGDDMVELSKRLENSETCCKTLLWLAHKFLKEKKGYITNKEVSEFLKKLPQRTMQILEIFVIHNILKTIKRGHFRATIYHLKDKKLLEDCIPLAKRKIGLMKE